MSKRGRDGEADLEDAIDDADYVEYVPVKQVLFDVHVISVIDVSLEITECSVTEIM